MNEHLNLKPVRFTQWSDSIAEAVRWLPPHALCDHDLYLTMLEQSLAGDGTVVVVSRDDVPQAVLGIRPDGRWRWKNLTNWIIPGFVCAAQSPDEIIPSFAAIRREVFIAWWRMAAPPSGPSVQEMAPIEVHALKVVDREEFWQGRIARTVRRSKTKCADLQMTYDEPGAAEWTVRSAAMKWEGVAAGSGLNTNLRVEVARALGRDGRLVTFLLRDGERRLAGLTCVIDGDTLVMGDIYRDESVGSLPTGVRVMAEMFDYAAEHGLTTVDLGGGYDYKSQWAPTAGARYDVVVAPRAVYLGRRKLARLLKRQ